MLNPIAWRGQSVLVTGHTGFKGSWLSLWLRALNAQVHGYALDPSTEPALFEAARVADALTSDTRGDIADFASLAKCFEAAKPEVIFHLAAQPLVRESYRTPVGTLMTNIIGTSHVLELARCSATVRAVVIVTTDKVYANREWRYPYREVDRLGGHDLYSASKAATEIVTAAYRSSFFNGSSGQSGARVATARAGNVIGGGDWANDRLIPDCVRAFAANQPVRLRYPSSVRPWQHVLECLSGYLVLAERLLQTDGREMARAWNFGPDFESDATVGEVAEKTASLWGPEARIEHSSPEGEPHEAKALRLDSSEARAELGWMPRWSMQRALEETVRWYQRWQRGDDMTEFTVAQIREYEGPVAV